MKKIYLLSYVFICFYGWSAQAQLTSLNENFNTSCPSGNHSPASWVYYNPPSTPDPLGAWTCDPSYGRNSSPGISCSGYFGTPATLHLDTSILISPRIDLSGYPDSIYLNFDTKTTNIHLAAKMDVLISGDTAFTDSSTHVLALRNVFDSDDSSAWRTHQASLSAYKYNPNFYIGFRYISAGSSVIASRWFLDNVNTTTAFLSVDGAATKLTAPATLKVIGTPARDNIILSYAGTKSAYDVELYDLVGRCVFKERITARSGDNNYNLTGLQLHEGMYIVKMGDESGYSMAKAIVQ
jgi:hypothetical protein